jgi:hypothetical protein
MACRFALLAKYPKDVGQAGMPPKFFNLALASCDRHHAVSCGDQLLGQFFILDGRQRSAGLKKMAKAKAKAN